jgi:uncharacterized protein (TIGR02284 family)
MPTKAATIRHAAWPNDGHNPFEIRPVNVRTARPSRLSRCPDAKPWGSGQAFTTFRRKYRSFARTFGPTTRCSAIHPFTEQFSMTDSSNDISNDISTLNGLIATTIDSVDGYRTSAQDVENPRYAEMFTARASERSSVAEQLRAEVRRLGGNPEDDGTILAAGHRTFVNLKAAVTGRDDQAIVNEVERGEDHIKAKYEAALEDSSLSPESRSLIQTAFASVKSGHDEMRNLKHNLEA